MGLEALLGIGADFAQIATGVVATFFGSRYMWRARKRRLRLEEYLDAQKKKDEGVEGKGHGLRTVLHLMSHLAMTEADVMEAAFTSKKITRLTGVDDKTGRADTLFFQFDQHGILN